MSDYITVARFSNLPEQGGVEIHLNGRRIALFKSEGKVFAVDALCPHRGGPLYAGWVENGAVFCPLHGWQFELASGSCRTVPEKSLGSYEVRVTLDEVQLRAGGNSPPAGPGDSGAPAGTPD